MRGKSITERRINNCTTPFGQHGKYNNNYSKIDATSLSHFFSLFPLPNNIIMAVFFTPLGTWVSFVFLLEKISNNLLFIFLQMFSERLPYDRYYSRHWGCISDLKSPQPCGAYMLERKARSKPIKRHTIYSQVGVPYRMTIKAVMLF